MPEAFNRGTTESKFTHYAIDNVEGAEAIPEAFWGGYYGAVLPWAAEQYKRRLDAMDPSAKAAALADIAGKAVTLAGTMRESDADAMKYAESVSDNAFEYYKVDKETEARLIESANESAVAIRGQDIEREERSALTPETEEKTRAARAEFAKAVAQANAGDAAKAAQLPDIYASTLVFLRENGASRVAVGEEAQRMKESIRATGALDGEDGSFMSMVLDKTARDQGAAIDIAPLPTDRIGGRSKIPRPAIGEPSRSYEVSTSTGSGTGGSYRGPMVSGGGEGGAPVEGGDASVAGGMPAPDRSATMRAYDDAKARLDTLYADTAKAFESPYGKITDPIMGLERPMKAGKSLPELADEFAAILGPRVDPESIDWRTAEEQRKARRGAPTVRVLPEEIE